MKERRRRLLVAAIAAVIAVSGALVGTPNHETAAPSVPTSSINAANTPPKSALATPLSSAMEALAKLSIKGRAAKTGYARTQFSDGWADAGNCDMRNFILGRDMRNVTFVSDQNCDVESGTLDDPYTARTIQFKRGPTTSDDVQIDHVVALSNAWQTGAQQLPLQTRHQFANDPLNLLAVDGATNQAKGDADAASWLPPNKAYRCPYVARQIAVKRKYTLWVTPGEHDAMEVVLESCPNQALPLVTNQ